jgi:hypothetical protein
VIANVPCGTPGLSIRRHNRHRRLLFRVKTLSAIQFDEEWHITIDSSVCIGNTLPIGCGVAVAVESQSGKILTHIFINRFVEKIG